MEELNSTTSSESHCSEKMGDGRQPGLLRRSSAAIRSRLHSSFLVPFFDQAVASATNVLVGIILARACDKSEFGLYTLGLTIIMFGLNIQMAVIWMPYTVFVPRMSGRRRTFYSGSTLAHQVSTSLFMIAAIALTFISVRSRFEDLRFVELFVTLSIVILPYLLREYCRRVMFANLEFAAALKLDLVVAGSQIILMLAVLVRFHLSTTIVFILIAVTTGVPSVWWLFKNRSMFKLSSNDVRLDWFKNWRFGKWVLGSTLLWSVQAYAMPWVVTHIGGLDSAGAWAACIGAIAIGNPFMLAIQNYVSPTLSSTYAKSGISGFALRVFRFAVVIAGASLGYLLIFIVAGKYLVVLMYGPAYAGLGLALSLLALNFTFSVIQIPITSALFVLDRAPVDFAVNFVSLTCFGLAVFPCVERFGLAGGAGVLAACTGFSLSVKAGVFLWLSVSGEHNEQPVSTAD